MLTQNDIKIIREIVKKEIDEKTRFIPTKEEFFSAMDKLMGELQSMREAFDLLTGRQSDMTDTLEDHEERIKKLEKPRIVPA